jgi:uncharacterized membrane protein YkvA (DUF1232 family)
MSISTRWKQWAQQVRTETYALYLAYRDPRVPWYAKVFAACIVAYALSPVDLIPDFIPVLGYLDDLILIPLGIIIAVKMIPSPVIAECREKARLIIQQGIPHSRAAIAIIIITIWLITIAIIAIIILRVVTD